MHHNRALRHNHHSRQNRYEFYGVKKSFSSEDFQVWYHGTKFVFGFVCLFACECQRNSETVFYFHPAICLTVVNFRDWGEILIPVKAFGVTFPAVVLSGSGGSVDICQCY